MADEKIALAKEATNVIYASMMEVSNLHGNLSAFSLNKAHGFSGHTSSWMTSSADAMDHCGPETRRRSLLHLDSWEEEAFLLLSRKQAHQMVVPA